jgi:hypothetical protein
VLASRPDKETRDGAPDSTPNTPDGVVIMTLGAR